MTSQYLIACDKFKGTLSSHEANQALAAGIREIQPDAQIQTLNVSDGGQGFLDAVQQVYELSIHNVLCLDARGKARMGRLGWDLDTDKIYIESADAIGLPWLSPQDRDPWLAHSEGLGYLIKFALELDPEEIIIGLGGSATCDGGLGCLKTLGYEPFGHDGIALPGRGASLAHVAKIIEGVKMPALTLVCDVNNPPIGPRSGVKVYSPQKGATPETVEQLEAGMQNWLQVLETRSGKQLADLVHGGAAGGLALGLHAVFDAKLVSGASWMLETLGFDTRLAAADYMITGEGAVDQSSFEGKITGEILKRSAQMGKPSRLISGQATAEGLKLPNQTHVFSFAERWPQAQFSGELSERALFELGKESALFWQK